jgi:L-ribulose-5-phosphate 4-epimerase
MTYKTIRQQLLDTVMRANEVELVHMSAGNKSARTADGNVAITPKGIKYAKMTAGDISIVDLDGNLIDGPPPSSETPMHTSIYRNLPDVGSICHTHSTYAITFAMLGVEIPPANLELVACGAPIPVAPWACPGTPQAGEVTVDLFRNRTSLKVILLRNHGLVAIGSDLEDTFDMAFNAEIGLQAYHQALQIGKPEPITLEQLVEIIAVYYTK